MPLALALLALALQGAADDAQACPSGVCPAAPPPMEAEAVHKSTPSEDGDTAESLLQVNSEVKLVDAAPMKGTQLLGDTEKERQLVPHFHMEVFQGQRQRQLEGGVADIQAEPKDEGKNDQAGVAASTKDGDSAQSMLQLTAGVQQASLAERATASHPARQALEQRAAGDAEPPGEGGSAPTRGRRHLDVGQPGKEVPSKQRRLKTDGDGANLDQALSAKGTPPCVGNYVQKCCLADASCGQQDGDLGLEAVCEASYTKETGDSHYKQCTFTWMQTMTPDGQGTYVYGPYTGKCETFPLACKA